MKLKKKIKNLSISNLDCHKKLKVNIFSALYTFSFPKLYMLQYMYMFCLSSMIQLKFEYRKYITVTSENRPDVCCHDSLLFD